MDTYFFKQLVKQSKKLGATTISVFGFGEPLIDQNLAGKIKICSDQKLDTFITTNGSLCTWTRMYDLFSAGLSHVRFSVHGIENTYSQAHKGLKWDTTITNIFSAITLRNRIFPECKISVTVIPMSGEDPDTFKAWELVGVDYLEIWKPHNWATQKEYREQTPERRKGCFRPFRGPLQIQWDGRVIPCCFLTDAEVILGDAHKQTLREILEGQAYREFREKHRVGDLTGLPCETCDQLNIEQENPLLYSSRDKDRNINTTSSLKFNLEV